MSTAKTHKIFIIVKLFLCIILCYFMLPTDEISAKEQQVQTLNIVAITVDSNSQQQTLNSKYPTFDCNEKIQQLKNYLEASSCETVKINIVDTIQVENFQDYQSLIDTLGLVESRNQKHFDALWIFSPTSLSKDNTVIVGRDTGTTSLPFIKADCDNFYISNFTYVNYNLLAKEYLNLFTTNCDTNYEEQEITEDSINTFVNASATSDKQHTLKVMVISIDPTITHPKTKEKMNASEYLGFSLDESINSLKQNIEKGTNDYLNINIVDTVYLKEYPKYTNTASITEKQFHKIYPYNDSTEQGEWYGWWSLDEKQHILPSEATSGFSYDYNYLIKKCNLVNLRNQGVFDMVWVFSIDPSNMYETAMIGKNPFWVNGAGYEADCDNFVIGGFTFSRKDGAIEAFCHLCESMMNYTYGVTDARYNSILKYDKLSELSNWEKFFLCPARTKHKVYGVGQVHSAPNGTTDYDWESLSPVQSYHRQFLTTYPDIKETPTETFTANEYLGNDPDPGTAYHVWWLQHIPHLSGRDSSGYQCNWWNYILSNKYVENLSPIKTNVITLNTGKSLEDIFFYIEYNTGKKVKTNITKSGAIMNYNSKSKIFSVSGTKITALSRGTEKLTLIYDGHQISYKITVQNPSHKVTVVNGKGSGTYEEDSKVTIKANASYKSKKFSNWEIVSGNVKLKSKERITSFTMPKSNVKIKAIYIVPQKDITIIGLKSKASKPFKIQLKRSSKTKNLQYQFVPKGSKIKSNSWKKYKKSITIKRSGVLYYKYSINNKTIKKKTSAITIKNN